ncbi:hypothetical protein C3F09_06205 [candidate division GN15 bacterium]|uniref:Outer membrane protein beta-barrel domain-containing protein n=1 Tax=candidate division GN15 bacterium TaxID=2072418 RepID=A0A855X7W4_9BACT|nr:MAG: hypothetical protein C3F09_06205 [candidate division GN15 bacterium]
MKKLIQIVGVVLILCIAASAQQSPVGVTGKGLKLGFDFASINTDYQELDEFLDSRSGFIGGAYLTYSINRRFALQPELLYASKGAQKDFFLFDVHWNVDYLEIPVLAKFQIAPDGRVQPNLFAGPAVSVLLSSKFEVINDSYDVADGMKTMDFSLVFGGGLDFKRFTCDLRYTLGLANTVDVNKINGLTGAEPGDPYYLTGDVSVKNVNISFMAGVKF